MHAVTAGILEVLRYWFVFESLDSNPAGKAMRFQVPARACNVGQLNAKVKANVERQIPISKKDQRRVQPAWERNQDLGILGQKGKSGGMAPGCM